MNTDIVRVSPPQWFSDIKAAIENPEILKYAAGSSPSGLVIPLELSEAFQTFHVRAIAHASSRGEHEALMYLSFYVIHLKKLWRASFKTWETYCDEIQAMPYGLSKTSIKTKVSIIQKLLETGVSIENIVQSLALAPLATDNVSRVEPEKLPAGGMDEAITNIIENSMAGGPGEAIRYVADLEGRPTFKVIEHHYNDGAGVFLFTLRVNDRPNNITRDVECVVKGLGPLEAEWFEARIGGRRGYRE